MTDYPSVRQITMRCVRGRSWDWPPRTGGRSVCSVSLPWGWYGTFGERGVLGFTRPPGGLFPQRILNPCGDKKRMRPAAKAAKTHTTMQTTSTQSTGWFLTDTAVPQIWNEG